MKELIESLLTYVNGQTGMKFERLGDAIKWLVEQYKSNNNNK